MLNNQPNKDNQIMKTLTNNEFKIYLKTLKTVFDCGNTKLEDDYQTVCEVHLDNSTSDIKDVVTIDGEDYQLNDSQVNTLYNMAYDEAEEHVRGAVQYLMDCQDDERHFEQLNLNYR